jgi:methylthioribose-1-phosphate isomerase
MTLAPSPLFEPVLWRGSGFRILDEVSLPERVEYLEVSNVEQALRAVKEMKTRAFGQVLTFLYSGALMAQGYAAEDPEPLRQRLAEMTRQFRAARPTFDFEGLGFHFAQWLEEPPGVNVGDRVAEQARALAQQIVNARYRRAERAASVLPNPARVLTHCNVSGELVAVGQICREMGKEFSVIATETRPYLQGARLTAWELSRAGIPVSLIPDCAIAQVMAKNEVNAVVVGSDRCARNGDVINKVGTYPLALMAKDYGVPFYVLVQHPGSLVRGADACIEERPASELLTFRGQPLLPEGGDKLAGRYPAFDITPATLISRLIGFDDCFTPERFQEKFSTASLPRTTDRGERGEYLLVFGVPRPESYAFLAHALKAEQAGGILLPEMRPQLWGARVVARELLRRDVPTTLISDNMMGALFAHARIRRLYLFCEQLGQEGPSAICGSLLAVRLARAHGVPIELQDGASLNEALADGDVSTFLGRRVSPDGVTIYPLEKETLPWALFKEKGAVP